jgi:anti-sigma B factor antagonist
MEFESRIQGDTMIILVDRARLDANVAVLFKERFRALTADHDGPVMLDMSRVDFLDSSGLGALVAAMKTLEDGRRLALAGCGDAIRRVLSLTRMDRVFDLHDGVPDGPAGDRTAA